MQPAARFKTSAASTNDLTSRLRLSSYDLSLLLLLLSLLLYTNDITSRLRLSSYFHHCYCYCYHNCYILIISHHALDYHHIYCYCYCYYYCYCHCFVIVIVIVIVIIIFISSCILPQTIIICIYRRGLYYFQKICFLKRPI